MGDFFSEVIPCEFPAIKFPNPKNHLFVVNCTVVKARIQKIIRVITRSQTHPQIAIDVLKNSLSRNQASGSK